MRNILIPATTSAVLSDAFEVVDEAVSLTCDDLSAGEEIIVQILHVAKDGGEEFIDYLINGDTQKFDTDNNVIELWDTALLYRLNKPVTINAVGVGINQL